MSALGSALAEQGRYDEAIKALYQAVNLKPKEKALHRQLGGVYARANNQEHSYEEMVVYIALERGTQVANAEEAAKKAAPAGSDAAKTLASMGTPEEVRDWDAEGQKYQTWLYWSKNVAFTFNNGKQAAKSDWGSPPPATAPAAPAAPKSAGTKKK
jgi:tetratricopeptide (TPR) repeat protein